MAKKEAQNFKKTALTDDALQVYTDTIDVKNKVGSSTGYGASFSSLSDQAQVLTALNTADSSGTRKQLVRASRLLYAINPTYARIIDYLATMYYTRYFVTPRLLDSPQTQKLVGDDWLTVYNQMMEIADGLNLDTKFSTLLHCLFIEGGVYFTTIYSEDSTAIDTIILPSEYCQRVGETVLGTDVIQFDMSYFDSLGLSDEELKDLLEGFPEEFNKGYNDYKRDNNLRWKVLNPPFSSCVLLNPKAIPTFLYALVGVRNYENYAQNELDKSTAALQTIVEHHIPTYQDKLLLETPEMNLLHKKLSSIVRTAKNTRLVTTIGDVKIHQLLEDNNTVADKTLENAYKSIFDTAGLNNGIFYGTNQYSVEASLSIDRGYVWQFIEKIANFYNVVVNSYGIDFKGYQLELTMMPISRDKTADDLTRYRENAKLGVGILPFMIASGIKQKNVDSYLDMEANLRLVDRLMPLRSSNTMSTDYEDDASSDESTIEEQENGN